MRHFSIEDPSNDLLFLDSTMVVIFLRHGSIIADDKVLVRSDPDGNRIPIAWAFFVWLGERLAIDENVTEGKPDGFTRQAEDSFHIHDPGRAVDVICPAGADAHHVPSFRLVDEVGEAVDEIDGVVFIGWRHADAVDANGQQDKFKNENAGAHQNRNSLQRPFGVPSDSGNAQPMAESRALGLRGNLLSVIVWHFPQVSCIGEGALRK